jgi:hypothetical protein
MAFETRQSASEGDGGLDGNISFNDFETFEQELDRLSSRWLQRHKPEDSYRSVCVTVLADVEGKLQPQMQGRFQAFKSRLDDAVSSRAVFQVANHVSTLEEAWERASSAGATCLKAGPAPALPPQPHQCPPQGQADRPRGKTKSLNEMFPSSPPSPSLADCRDSNDMAGLSTTVAGTGSHCRPYRQANFVSKTSCDIDIP